MTGPAEEAAQVNVDHALARPVKRRPDGLDLGRIGRRLPGQRPDVVHQAGQHGTGILKLGITAKQQRLAEQRAARSWPGPPGPPGQAELLALVGQQPQGQLGPVLPGPSNLRLVLAARLVVPEIDRQSEHDHRDVKYLGGEQRTVAQNRGDDQVRAQLRGGSQRRVVLLRSGSSPPGGREPAPHAEFLRRDERQASPLHQGSDLGPAEHAGLMSPAPQFLADRDRWIQITSVTERAEQDLHSVLRSSACSRAYA